MAERTNPITPAGFAALRERYEQLFAVDRPAVVEIVHWAAGNGDRSENGDYIYGKKRLREIDRRIRFLNQRLEFAVVVDNSTRKSGENDVEQVFFGATVTYSTLEGPQAGKETLTHRHGREEKDIGRRADGTLRTGWALSLEKN